MPKKVILTRDVKQLRNDLKATFRRKKKERKVSALTNVNKSQP